MRARSSYRSSGGRAMTGEQRDNRMVKMADLWERTSAKGTRYFSGFMGDCQLLLFDGGEKDHLTRPGETVHVWRLMVQERDPSRRPQTRSVERGQRTWDRSRDTAQRMQEPPQIWLDESEAAIRDLERGPGR
jgi:hypothetical protein